jgi:8-amino-7-oxononanoate synthase
VIAGSADAALGFSAKLRDAGFWATAIRPPTVPQGTARVRFAFTGAHDEADIDRLLDVLGDMAAPQTVKAVSA